MPVITSSPTSCLWFSPFISWASSSWKADLTDARLVTSLASWKVSRDWQPWVQDPHHSQVLSTFKKGQAERAQSPPFAPSPRPETHQSHFQGLVRLSTWILSALRFLLTKYYVAGHRWEAPCFGLTRWGLCPQPTIPVQLAAPSLWPLHLMLIRT